MNGDDAMTHLSRDDAPNVAHLPFDTRSGSLVERLIFNWRWVVLVIGAIATLLLGYQASMLQVNASFEKMIPQSNSFIRNYFDNAKSLRGLGNSVRVVVENKTGNVYDPVYLKTLRDINDKIYLMPGVDRSFVKSLWMPVVRWNEVTAEGFRGGPVMPDELASKLKTGNTANLNQSIDQLRQNVDRSGIVGSLVANDLRSSMIFVPLMDHDPATGKAIDYRQFRDKLNTVRSFENDHVAIHIIGFAELMGDLIHGLISVMRYFVVAAAVAIAMIFLYTRCVRSTILVIGCSLVAVLWQLGALRLAGFVLDPYSILVPFLVFAIGVSHGAQKMNGIMQDVGRGIDKYVAARFTFRRLFLAGLTALVADAVGFAVLLLIDIPVIRGLAVAASIGVAILIFTNLVLLPVMLSYVGVSLRAAARSISNEEGHSHRVRAFLCRFTQRRVALIVLVCAAGLTVGGLLISQHLQIGDLDPGAPELRPNSVYNLDNRYITSHYSLSSDQFAVIVKTPLEGIATYETLLEMDRLEQMLRALPGVQTTVSAASLGRQYTAVGYEGDGKWMTINRDRSVVGDAINNVFVANPEMMNEDHSVAPIIAFLADHKAVTLNSVVKTVEAFASAHNSSDRSFLLAAGSAGIEAATNIVVEQANERMLFLVYAAVVALCFITFRSWRAVVVAVLPLAMTSILCEALMVLLGFGVKVATLPVVALGVGIGVDYSLYLLTVQLQMQRQGMPLDEAFGQALGFTGKVVALIGLTLAAAVSTWALSPIKFQSDMGILLTFMFVWNMVGALVVTPALSRFLLSEVGLEAKSRANLASSTA
jgi:predicted RND superfamily exporter protein